MGLPGNRQVGDRKRGGRATRLSRPLEILQSWGAPGSRGVFFKDQGEGALGYRVAFVDPVWEPSALAKPALQYPIGVGVFRIHMLLFEHGQQDNGVSANLAGFPLDQRLHPLRHLCRAGIGNDLGKGFVWLFWGCTQHHQLAIRRTRRRVNGSEQLDVCDRGVQAVPASSEHSTTDEHQPQNSSLHRVRSLPWALSPCWQCQLRAYHSLRELSLQPSPACLVSLPSVVICALSLPNNVTASEIAVLRASCSLGLTIIFALLGDGQCGIDIAFS